MRISRHRWAVLWVSASLGTLWLGGCVTDLAARDFFTSTLIRVFYQALGSLFQASIVNGTTT